MKLYSNIKYEDGYMIYEKRNWRGKKVEIKSKRNAVRISTLMEAWSNQIDEDNKKATKAFLKQYKK